MSAERDIADAFDRWLRGERMLFRRDRMDKATTCLRGWPDFEILSGNRGLWIELKAEKGQLSRDQINLHARFEENGCKVHVVRDLATAITLVTEWRSMIGVVVPRSLPVEQLYLFGNAVFRRSPSGEPHHVRRAGPGDNNLPQLNAR